MHPSRNRILLHALALGGVLVVCLVVSRPGVPFTSDEGAAGVQARMIENGDGWRYKNPFPLVDPAGRAQPFPHGDAGRKGLAPYAKHPLYPLVLAGGDKVFGTMGFYLVSVLGGVLAALAASFIAGALSPRASLAALWTTGLVSPLFFDSFVVLAHTLAAAGSGMAALLAWRALTSPSRRWVAIAGAGASVAVAMLLRSEAVFLGPALAVAALVVALRDRDRRAPAAWLGGVVLAFTAVSRVVETQVVRSIVGASVALNPPNPSNGFLSDRWEGFYRTWLQPAYSGQGRGAALAVGALGAGSAALFVRAGRRVPAIAAFALATGGYVGALVIGPAGVVPGVLPAFPLVAAGLLLIRRPTLQAGDRLATFLLLGFAVAAAGVLLTQYRIGGGVEWGGRYFAFLLPLAVPVLVVALTPPATNATASGRPGRAAALVIATLLPVLGIQALRQSHEATRVLLRRLDVVAAQAPPGDRADHRPVVVSTERLLPQLAWNQFDRYRWLTPEPGDFAGYGPRLARAGVRRIVLVSGDLKAQLGALAPWYRQVRVAVLGRAPVVAVTVLERTSVP